LAGDDTDDEDTDDRDAVFEEPGDHDALPHVPTTHPGTIPPDRGDGGGRAVTP
jgi:hypothetical protein